MNRSEWLKERLNGIGASEAAAIMGVSPYKTNVELWEEKTGRRVPEDISNNEYVKYGIEAEQHLRALFALDFPEYEVSYQEFEIIKNPQYPFIFATLDGKLIERQTKRKGILEIKTTEIRRGSDWDKWSGRIPDEYYIQIVHQLIATGWEFSILKAQIKHQNKFGETEYAIRHYHIDRSEVSADIALLFSKEIEFWMSVTEDKRPDLILPNI